jgi:hypothetical protein
MKLFLTSAALFVIALITYLLATPNTALNTLALWVLSAYTVCIVAVVGIYMSTLVSNKEHQ